MLSSRAPRASQHRRVTQRFKGSTDPQHVSTSVAERQNLSMRMQMRRFTRPTNAFSKKFENHVMVALYTVWYNYVKQHKSLKGLTPAMATGQDALEHGAHVATLVEAAASRRRGDKFRLRHYPVA